MPIYERKHLLLSKDNDPEENILRQVVSESKTVRVIFYGSAASQK